MARKSTIKFSYASDFGWANGEAPTKYAGSVASYEESAGIDVFRYPGELATGFAATELGAGTIADTLVHILPAVYGTGATITPLAYCYGDQGKMYSVTDVDTPVVTLIGTQTNPMPGFEVHKDYVYYAQSTNVGRYGPINAGSPSEDDSYWTSFSANFKGYSAGLRHPLHSWKGTLYAGDNNKLRSVLGSESTGTTGTTDITLDTDHCITAIWDDGSRLLFGAGMSPDPDEDSNVPCWLHIWNGTDDSFTDRIPFPEPYINNIKVVNNEILVFGVSHLYRLVGRDFQIVRSVGQRVGLGGAFVRKGALYWKDNGMIKGFGTPDPQLPKAVYSPIGGTGTSKGAIAWMQNDKLWYGENDNMYEAKTGSQTTKTWKSRAIAFGQDTLIDTVKVYLAANLASGDDLRIVVYDEVGSATTIAQFDFATYGAINHLELHSHGFANALGPLTSCQVGVLFQAGSARLSEVIIETQPVSQP